MKRTITLYTETQDAHMAGLREQAQQVFAAGGARKFTAATCVLSPEEVAYLTRLVRAADPADELTGRMRKFFGHCDSIVNPT